MAAVEFADRVETVATVASVVEIVAGVESDAAGVGVVAVVARCRIDWTVESPRISTLQVAALAAEELNSHSHSS